ncbi:hypothetical protein BC936DRAFT_145511 [Jimgerdemannia flammicorona]|uniref:Uncharacterized protein n=1 Tax=Jimgerdemannia flammicorona TaxID=994334 RepID=A0A433D9U5_9FUNG|nr:hypothetical protein BC936DRAFT_145511 [Jimgerdemannia flammicorona]
MNSARFSMPYALYREDCGLKFKTADGHDDRRAVPPLEGIGRRQRQAKTTLGLSYRIYVRSSRGARKSVITMATTQQSLPTQSLTNTQHNDGW